MSAKQDLKDWIKYQKSCGIENIATSDIYAWGVRHFSNRAVRNAQDFAAKGELLQRIPNAEAILLGFSGNEGVWRII